MFNFLQENCYLINLNSFWAAEEFNLCLLELVCKHCKAKKRMEGLNLTRGSNQKSHVLSTLELRFMFYLLALKGDNYKAIMKLNSFDELPKLRYLPTYMP